VGSIQSSFTSNHQNFLVGAAHDGYTENFRENRLSNSIQVNYNANRNVQLDIDPWNPAYFPPIGVLTHGYQVISNAITGGDTNYSRVAEERKLNIYNCP
jgi:hypothetical protein